ncbi:MAG: helix-turn-helix domain containing protein [Sorangiineae bacterium]|nr:helix-turn-helix domain containing protein [Sorangiineae bacterium]
MSKRAYDNTFRAEQAEQTRTRLLHAARDLMAELPRQPVSMADVATRAGVSEPTAYRYFPSRDVLFESLAELHARELDQPPLAEDPADLPLNMIALSHYFGRNAAWMRSSMVNPRVAAVRARGRKRRAGLLRAMLAPRLSHLEEREREVALAFLLAMARFETWDFIIGHGLDDDEAGRAMAWAVQAFLDALARDRRVGRRTLLDAETMDRGRAWGAATAEPKRARARRAGRGR